MARIRFGILPAVFIGAFTACSSAGVSTRPAPPADPSRAALDELIATDRKFSDAGATTDLVSALRAMFAADVSMQAPGGHVAGADAAVEALQRNADNARSRATWTPVRGGISSDGQHGFTFGYMTVTRPDGSQQPGKYVAYWVRQPNGWRVAAYKRAPRPAGDVSLAMWEPSLPVPGLPVGDSATVARYADELRAAELAFSADAAPLGLGPAFVKHGAVDAANVGGPNEAAFVRGNEAIGRAVGAGSGTGAGIAWAPTKVIVASTGDLGVSIGTIRITIPGASGGAAQTRETPFFTIWKRATPRDAWKYVAE